MTQPVPRWRIEILADRPPLKEVWNPLRHVSGRLYRFVDESEAKAALAELLEHQPHMKAITRIAPM